MDSGRPPRHAAPKRGAPRHARQPARGRRWRARAVTASILVLVLVGALALSVHALDQAPQTPPAALLGAWVAGDSSTASSQQVATEQLEAAMGRKLAIGHSFVRWGRDLGSLPAWNVAAGRTPMLSFGRDVSAGAVAGGRYDAWLVSLARSVSELGRPLLLRYAWAMDSTVHRDSGRDATAYVAAWRHVHDLFATQGVRGSWVWAPNADAFAGARGGVDRYWPGDGYVDWIGADGFNRGTCDGGSTWSSFEAIFRAFYSWGSAKGKPLMVSETGTVEDAADPSRKSAWYADAASTLARSMPGIRAVVYFDQGGRCDWRPDTSVQSMQGFIRFARDPFFGGTGNESAPTTTTPPTTVAPTTSTVRPTTTAPTTTVPPTTVRPTTTAPTTTAPQPASKCATGGGVAIGTADNAQSVVNAHAAGTTYLVKTGIHLGNFSVRPKSGDSFCGEPGAVLDGGRSLQTAFSGGATDVTLDSIIVRDYNSAKQGAAIQPEPRASGWVVRNVSALHNAWAGLLVADGMRILGGHYNDNDQLGIGGNAATGILLDGLDADPTTIDGPELARNHTLHVACGWEAGGMKWDVGQVTIRNAYVHDNDCRGLWADINARGAVIEHNLIEDNLAEGIFYEISQDAVIRYNQVYRNGYEANGWYWDAGINVNGSFNVEVYGNRLSGNYNGITGIQQDRPDSTPPAHLLDHYHVHDNLICATGGGGHPTGVVADNGANLATRDITFSGNTLQSATCE